MSTVNIQGLIQKHNTKNVLKTIAFLILSIVFWYVSYWILKVLFWIPLAGFNVESAGKISSVIAVIGCILLVFEGVRYGKPQFDFTRTATDFTNDQGHWSSGGAYYAARNAAFVHIITHILFCAPRFMVHAITCMKNIIRNKDGSLETANSIINQLIEKNQWIKKESLPQDEEAIDILRKLKLIRYRDFKVQSEIGLSPAARKEFDVEVGDVFGRSK